MFNCLDSGMTVVRSFPVSPARLWTWMPVCRACGTQCASWSPQAVLSTLQDRGGLETSHPSLKAFCAQIFLSL